MSFGRMNSEDSKRNTMLSSEDYRINGISNSISNNWPSNKQSVNLKSSDDCKKSSNGSLKSN